MCLFQVRPVNAYKLFLDLLWEPLVDIASDLPRPRLPRPLTSSLSRLLSEREGLPQRPCVPKDRTLFQIIVQERWLSLVRL